ncbi:DUF5683 domain-containing protein [Sinomicrobium weinanense]|uniref:DUF5683 domain-containing protein n=1 Tax=Sinomicrobium weinanense TaxID=2842200 RepID=A0A926JRB1_9FLAO|nr:DUF5683 domain-containing protein [Sinomicrobium weinanense]MBC9796065.1 hypothetical protein [Sinomicrobium weinanense]MBU3123116.1 hypothetical protein [Sinomicrobium weinanense]
MVVRLLPVLFACLFSLGCGSVFAQEKEEQDAASDSANVENRVVIDSIIPEKHTIDPLSPSKAAFYSAILPGLGQIYNKRYWKVPLVYGAIGTGLYFYVTNKDQYHRYRNAYKRRLAGFNDDEFYNIDGTPNEDGSPDVSMDALRRAQEYYQRYKDLSLLITIGLYALNIIDANVDAHLKQHNIGEDLTLRPMIIPNDFNAKTTVGLSLSFDF